MILDVRELFPTAVAYTQLPREFTEAELQLVKDQKVFTRQYSNLMGTDLNILDKPEFQDIKSFIQEAIDKYMKEIEKTNQDVSIYLTQSWLNYTDASQQHPNHIHPNSYISGVLYMNVQEGLDSIMFHKPLSAINLKVDHVELNRFTEEVHRFPVKTGLLVLFPSHLQHGVLTNAADHSRISLAFNTFLKGTIGNYHSYAQLIL